MMTAVRLLLLGTATLTGFALPAPAVAQTQIYRFDVKAQSLDGALRAFARTTRLQVLFDGRLVRGKSSNGASGTMTADQALAAILTGSGLHVMRGASGAVVIRSGPQASAAAALSARPTSLAIDPLDSARKTPPPQSQNDDPNDIVVTANKRSERMSEVPAAVNVVTKNFLDNKAASRLTDYIGYLPNVQIQSQGATGYARIYIRGVTVIGSGSSVGTYIDGIPFGSSTSFARAASLQPDLDPSILASVEVLKGPQGTLYGSGSTGGLIKYSTLAPSSRQFDGSASVEGSFADHGSGGYAVRAYVTAPVSDTIAVLISGFARQDPAFIDNLASGKPDENVTLSKGFLGKLLIAPTNRLTVTASAFYQSLHGKGLNSVAVMPGPLGNGRGLQGAPVYGNYATSLYAKPGNVARDQLYSLDVEYELPFASVSALTSYSTLRGLLSVGDGGLVYQGYGVSANDKIGQEIGGETRKFTQELRVASRDTSPLKWMVGGYYTHENSTGRLALTAYLPTGLDVSVAPGGNVYTQLIPSTYAEYSAFGNATLTILPNLDITAGGRYSSYRQHYTQLRSGAVGNAANPGAFRTYADRRSNDEAITYVASLKFALPGGNGLIYARIASGYRVGGPTVLPVSATPPAGFTDAFRPENLTNYEIGFRRGFFRSRVSVDASAFYIDYRDMQGNVRIGTFNITGNPGNATSKGVEASVRVKLVRGLEVSGAFGYNESTLSADSPAFGARKGDTLPNAPRYTASGNVDYVVPIGGEATLFANAGVRYVSSQIGGFSSTQELTFPGSTVADLQIGLRYRGFTGVLFAKNVTNSYQYEGDVRSTTNGPAYVAVTPPRTIGLRLSRKF